MLLICAVIVVLFLGAFVNIDTSYVVAALFIAAMTAFFAGLVMFLREITVAARHTRIGLERATSAKRDATR